MCDELNIKEDAPCRPGAPSCVYRLGARDLADGSPCAVATGRLICRSADEPTGCLVSSASVKKDIEYLTPEDVSEAAREIRELPLVRYRYKSQTDGVTPTVGIVIEDVPGASFVDRENKRVNLYSFVSATAAAYQAQARELDVLKARLAEVEARCGRVAGGGPCGNRNSTAGSGAQQTRNCVGE